MERVLLIIYSCITLLGLLLFTRLFTFHVNQLQFAPSSTVVKSGPRVRHFCRLLHLENGTQNKCKECLAAYESLGRVNRSTAVGSFATHILCPECRERIRLPDRDPHIHLSVKTAKVFHRTRLSLLFFTWMQTVDPDQIYVVTDEDEGDVWINEVEDSGIHVTKTPCPKGHCRSCLCCKASYEFEQYYRATSTGKMYRWYCHFDDDEYLNIRALSSLLQQYNSSEKFFFGKWPSCCRMEPLHVNLKLFPEATRDRCKYATGAVYCMSASLMVEMERYIRGKKFIKTCNKLRLADDESIGAIVECLLGYKLTDIPTMTSHLDHQQKIPPKNLTDMITISTLKGRNSIKISQSHYFTETEDPTRFLSYHCLLHPHSSWCESKNIYI